MTRALLVLLVLLCPSICHGEEFRFKLKPIPPGPDEILDLKKDMPAPYDGKLFKYPTALRWGNYIDQCLDRWRLDVTALEKLRTADLLNVDNQRKQEVEALNTALKNERAERARVEQQLSNSQPFYTNVWFGVAVGVSAAGLAVLAIGLVKLGLCRTDRPRPGRHPNLGKTMASTAAGA